LNEEPQPENPGPLAGIRVLDFSRVLAGPFTTRFLADAGAEVIKVERPALGDDSRHFPWIIESNGVKQSGYYIYLNRGKKSICVNLKDAKGLEIIRKLVEKCDILIENFSPGTMARLGLGYDEVRKINPRVIFCSISCFGQHGPYSSEPGYDIVSQGASGWIAMSGEPNHPPLQSPVSIGDMNAALHALGAILMALYYREKTGIGQFIDISMVDCLFNLHESAVQWYILSGRKVKMGRVGRHHPGYVPYGVYQCRDGYVVIAALNDELWKQLVTAMGKEYEWLLTDPRFNLTSTRCHPQNTSVVAQIIEEWTKKFNCEDILRILKNHGVPCTKVKTIDELCDNDPHIKAREMLVKIRQPFIGDVEVFGSPLKFSSVSSCPRGHAPLTGEHNEEILIGLLGYTKEELSELYREGVLYKV